ncbi:HNH endonuclease [Sulfurimonas sp.]|uniref:HNH endonuclease n=1 Tax=Sulfurimonas sp. TaxID=2022749 RepID=UPI001A0C1529|nr:HNH endonuclease [Sulfurimonas sp.]MBE0515112.1 HNH endonuclease [Sulfurimonas sp.]
MSEQKYEEYWKLTLEYTDINSEKFIGTLEIIVNFISNHYREPYSSKKYDRLQQEVNLNYPKADMGSVRKSINQFVKLGFIHPFLVSYNPETIEFINARTNRKRQTIFSKIIYKYSSFNSSITNFSAQKEVNFLLKTLEEVATLTKENIIGLMNINILDYHKGYVTADELNFHTNIAIENGFVSRKYNQVGYFLNLLNKLDDIIFINNILYFEEDAKVIFGEDLKQESRKRDGYLHRIYKNLLKEEADEKCMVENLSYPSLVASHIKPFIQSDENEAYDPNNGLLLSRNMDILFDQGHISFRSDGSIVFSSILDGDVKVHLNNYTLDNNFINDKRLEYLQYHRENIFEKKGLI